MGAAMFGLHAYPDDPDWKGWWGDHPPFGYSGLRAHPLRTPPVDRDGRRHDLHFRSGTIEDVLAEATTAAGGLDVRVGGGVRTAGEFLRAGLVDDLHVGIAPIVLARGNRVSDCTRGIEHTHKVTTEVAESGTVHVTFTR